MYYATGGDPYTPCAHVIPLEGLNVVQLSSAGRLVLRTPGATGLLGLLQCGGPYFRRAVVSLANPDEKAVLLTANSIGWSRRTAAAARCWSHPRYRVSLRAVRVADARRCSTVLPHLPSAHVPMVGRIYKLVVKIPPFRGCITCNAGFRTSVVIGIRPT